MSCYDKKELQQIKAYYEKEGIVCVKDILNTDIARETRQLPLYTDNRVSSRKTVCLPNHHSVSKKMYGDSSVQRIFHHLHQYELKPSMFPLEYREYQPHSDGMRWHRDLAMFESPYQVEMVYTVFNDDEKTRFQWEDSSGKIQTIQPRQNDMVFVRPNGPKHRVTGLGGNKRGIIKMIGHRSDANPLSTMHHEKSNCPLLKQ